MIDSRVCTKALHTPSLAGRKFSSQLTWCCASGPRLRSASSMRATVALPSVRCENTPAIPHMFSVPPGPAQKYRFDVVQHARQVKTLARARDAGGTHALAQWRVRHESLQGGAEHNRITRVNQESRDLGLDRFGDAADRGRHDRQAAGHRLHDTLRDAFIAVGGKREYVESREPLGHVALVVGEADV